MRAILTPATLAKNATVADMAMLNEQHIINIALGLISVLGGNLFRIVWKRLEQQEQDFAKLLQEVSEIKVLVAGEYAKRADVEKGYEKIMSKLDRIEDKLEKKADK